MKHLPELRRRGKVASALIVAALLATVVGSVAGAGATAPSLSSPTYASLATPGSPVAVAASPSGLYVLLAGSCSTVYALAGTGFVSFATLPSVSKCPGQSIAVSPGFSNFPAGEVYVSQGAALFAVAPGNNPSVVSAPWALSAPISGAITGLAFDYYGMFAGTLLVTAGTSGLVYAVDANGHVTSLGAFGTSVVGPAVAPLTFGGVGGELMANGKTGGNVYAFNVSGAVTAFSSWKTAQSVAFVPPLSCSFANLTYFVADSSANSVLGFPASDFSSLGGYGLVVGGGKGAGIGLMSSSGATSPFFSLRASLGGSAYVACPVGITTRVHLPPAVFPDLVGFDPVNNQLVGTDANSSQLLFLNGDTGALLASRSGGVAPFGLTLNPKKNVLYVSNTGSNNVTILNASTDAVVGALTGLSGPTGIAYDANNQKLYVANSLDGTVMVFSQVGNPFNNGNITIGGTLRGLLYDPVDLNIYVVDAAGSVTVISPNFNSYQTIALGTAASGITVNTTSGTVFVTEPLAGKVAAIRNGSIVANITVGLGPTGIVYDAQNGFLVVANNGSGTYSIVRGLTVIDTILVGTNLGPVVYDSISGIVYGTADVTSLGIDPRIILGSSS